MKLAKLQKAVALAVMQPLTRNEQMRSVGPRGGACAAMPPATLSRMTV